MTFRRHLSREIKGSASGRLEAGYNPTELHRRFNINPLVVHRFWKLFRTTDLATKRITEGWQSKMWSADD